MFRPRPSVADEVMLAQRYGAGSRAPVRAGRFSRFSYSMAEEDGADSDEEVISQSASFRSNSKIPPKVQGALAYGQHAMLNEIKQQGADIEQVDARGRTWLHLAAMCGNNPSVKWLIQEKARVDALDYEDSTPLAHAVERSHLQVVSTLINRGADTHTIDRYSRTLLHIARAPDVVQMLLNLNCDTMLEAEEFRKRTPLHLAAKHGVEVKAMCILIERRANLEAEDMDGRRPLHLAAIGSSEELLEALLQAGAQKDSQDKNQYTSLLCAAETGSSGCTQLLLEAKSSVYSKDNQGRTALHVASQNGYSSTVQLLLAHDAPIEDRDELGRTPLHLAGRRGSIEVVNVLVRARANIEAKEKYGAIPIEHAGLFGSTEVFLQLMKLGSPVSAECLADLIKKAGCGCMEVLESLLDFPSDPDWKRETAKVKEAVFADSVLSFLGHRHTHDEDESIASIVEELGYKAMQGRMVGVSVKRCNLLVIEKLSAHSLTHPQLIKAFASTPTEDVLNTDAAYVIISMNWDTIWGRYLLVDCFPNLLAIAGLIWASVLLRTQQTPNLSGPAALLIIQAIRKLLDEFVRIYNGIRALYFDGRWSYFTELLTYVNYISTILDVIGATALIRNNYDTTIWNSVIAACCSAQWFICLYNLRLMKRFGPEVLPILWACVDTWPFFCVLSLSLVGASHAYYTLGATEDSLYQSLYPVIILGLTGKTTAKELEGYKAFNYTYNSVKKQFTPDTSPPKTKMYYAVQVFFFVVLVAINVILMNLLIAVLEANYEHHHERSREKWLRHRASAIATMRDSPWTWLMRRIPGGKYLIGIDPGPHDFIWACREIRNEDDGHGHGGHGKPGRHDTKEPARPRTLSDQPEGGRPRNMSDQSEGRRPRTMSDESNPRSMFMLPADPDHSAAHEHHSVAESAHRALQGFERRTQDRLDELSETTLRILNLIQSIPTSAPKERVADVPPTLPKSTPASTFGGLAAATANAPPKAAAAAAKPQATPKAQTGAIKTVPEGQQAAAMTSVTPQATAVKAAPKAAPKTAATIAVPEVQQAAAVTFVKQQAATVTAAPKAAPKTGATTAVPGAQQAVAATSVTPQATTVKAAPKAAPKTGATTAVPEVQQAAAATTPKATAAKAAPKAKGKAAPPNSNSA